MPTLTSIEGIGEKYAAPLKELGVRSVASLLKVGGTKKGRKDLAKATGLSEKRILNWVNRADLFRVKGIGEEYSDLLEAAGVDTVVELSKRRVDNLHAALVKTNEKKNLVRRVPPMKSVEKWVASAKELPRAVSY